jgi:cold shock CspA family protein
MSSDSSAVSSSASVQLSERFTGRVKWFNNKAGYGFVTITDGPKSGNEVFVHHSSIKVEAEQYKYLVQGEYIEFSLSEAKTANNDYQAGDVSGIKGGKLMCETRSESRSSRTHYRTTKSEHLETSEPVKMPRSVNAPRVRGDDKRDWTYVSKETPRTTSTQLNRTSSGRRPARPRPNPSI